MVKMYLQKNYYIIFVNEINLTSDSEVNGVIREGGGLGRLNKIQNNTICDCWNINDVAFYRCDESKKRWEGIGDTGFCQLGWSNDDVSNCLMMFAQKLRSGDGSWMKEKQTSFIHCCKDNLK
jgi:hypothetical protein